MNEPKISVIIPLYNAEKYIRQCLISVLASKFTDYEVLVVDDCSTDNSVAEVTKLLPHFDGRLKIFATEKNSGGPGGPRNIGIKNAAGKYVTFIDNDDMILPDALGMFFELAEAYGADVVHTERFLTFDKEFNGRNAKIYDLSSAEKSISAPTFEPADLNHRMHHFIHEKFSIMPWSKVYRRDFLLKNQIEFPQIQYGEDFVFCFKCLCLAKKYLLVPYAINLHRIGIPSAANVRSTPQEGVRLFLKILLTKLAVLNEFMGALEFFKVNPAWHRDVLKFCVDIEFDVMKLLPKFLSPPELQKILFDELQNPELSATGKNILTAYLCTEKFLAR